MIVFLHPCAVNVLTVCIRSLQVEASVLRVFQVIICPYPQCILYTMGPHRMCPPVQRMRSEPDSWKRSTVAWGIAFLLLQVQTPTWLGGSWAQPVRNVKCTTEEKQQTGSNFNSIKTISVLNEAHVTQPKEKQTNNNNKTNKQTNNNNNNETNKQTTTIKQQQTNKQKTSPFSLFRLPSPLPLLTTNSVHIFQLN